jgi:hypothetical protein
LFHRYRQIKYHAGRVNAKYKMKIMICARKQEGILGAMPIQSADQASLWATPIPALTNSLLKFQGKATFFPRRRHASISFFS